MTVRNILCLSAALQMLTACGEPTTTDAGQLDGGGFDGSTTLCGADRDCGDQDLFCAQWRCLPGESGTDARGCVNIGSPCAEGEGCNEELALCGAPAWCTEGRDGCLLPGDCDGDGSRHALECGGDDCDDDDPDRFPGNPEVCDAAGLDEDCNPDTFAGESDGDMDGDGYISARCCNGDNCGDDCNDDVREIYPGARELCNAVDDDCDGEIDEGGAFCPVGTCVQRRCRGLGWEKTFGSSSTGETVSPRGLTVDAAGNSYLFMVGEGDFDEDGSAEPAGSYIASYEAGGRHRWHTMIPESSLRLARGSGTDALIVVGSPILWISRADGSIIRDVAIPVPAGWDDLTVLDGAWFDNSLYVVGELESRGSDPRVGSILLRLDSVGQETARRVFEITDGGTSPYIRVQAIGVSAAGIAISGWTEAPLDVGNGYTVEDLFVARLSLEMHTLWTVNLAAPLGQPDMISISSLGEVAISGRFNGRFDPPWGGPQWEARGKASAAFILVLSPDGTHRWHRVQDDRWASFGFVEFDERGGVIVAGSFTTAFDMSPGIGGTLLGDPFGDPLFCVLAASDGFVQDARAFAGPAIEGTHSAAVDDFGNIVLLGYFRQGITLPRGTYTASTTNAWAVRLADIP